MQQVVPLYFQQTHFRSFVSKKYYLLSLHCCFHSLILLQQERQLNKWGFERYGRQGWRHEHFVRGNGEELHLIQIKARPRPQQDPVETSSYPSGQVPFQSQGDGGFGDIFGHQQPSQPTSTEAATGKAYGGSGFRPPTASRLTSSRGRSSNATPNIQPDDDKDDTLLLMSKSIHFDDRVPCSCSFCLAYKIASSEDYRPRPPASQKKDLT